MKTPKQIKKNDRYRIPYSDLGRDGEWVYPTGAGFVYVTSDSSAPRIKGQYLIELLSKRGECAGAILLDSTTGQFVLYDECFGVIEYTWTELIENGLFYVTGIWKLEDHENTTLHMQINPKANLSKGAVDVILSAQALEIAEGILR